MKTIAFNATKGGTGKSTLSIITLNCLISAGFKCLAIDADMINHSLSFYFNRRIPFETITERNIFNAFVRGSIKDNIITIHDRLDLVHGDVRLSNYRSTESLKRLKKILLEAVGYDYIVIDTAPTFDNITANVFYASDYLIIPVIPDVFNHQSAKFLFEKLEDMEFPTLNKTIILNQYERSRTDNKEAFSNQVVELFKEDADLNPFIGPMAISKSSVIRKYTNNPHYRINGRQETIKQFTEIKNFIHATLAVTLNAEAI